MEDIGYPVIPFFSGIIVKGHREEHGFMVAISARLAFINAPKRVAQSDREAMPLKEEKLGGDRNGD